eukprot:c44760_g1_i1 orf=2-205(-)
MHHIYARSNQLKTFHHYYPMLLGQAMRLFALFVIDSQTMKVLLLPTHDLQIQLYVLVGWLCPLQFYYT